MNLLIETNSGLGWEVYDFLGSEAMETGTLSS